MQSKTESIVIIGSGSVASTLGKALYESGHEILEVASRHLEHAKVLGEKINAKRILNDISKINTFASLYIIAVSDDAISEVINKMPKVNGIVVHTSGTSKSSLLKAKHKNWGIFYPLQSFTAGRKLDYNKIPILITTENKKIADFLTEVASSIGSSVFHLEDSSRIHIHIVAVMINNFTNHLLVLASEYMKSHELPSHLFHSLLLETVHKAIDLGAANSQTGPAKRGDMNTINQHLEIIQEQDIPAVMGIYKMFTKSIMQHHSSNLS
jgi:predicted short-subunit dehydrogenase-like oxidoreductase (DUF2520 family)